MNEKAEQLTEGDLKSMTPEAINQARSEGRLNTILGGTVAPTEAAIADTIARATNGAFLDTDDLNALAKAGRHDLINKARRAGHI